MSTPSNTLQSRYQNVIDSMPLEKTGYLTFLPHLLCALNWNQSPKLLTQYLSQFEQFNWNEFSLLLKTMGYRISKNIEGKSLLLLQQQAHDTLKVTEHRENATFAIKSQFATPVGSTWFKETLHHFRNPIRKIFFISLLLNLFLIAIPLLTKQVYDKVIGSHSAHTLLTLAIGAVIILSMIALLRFHRSHLMSFLGNQVTYNAQYQVMQKLLRLPLMVIAQSSLYGHLMRIKGLEMIKELSSGTLGKALMDLPFIIITLIVIFIVGHAIVIVPIITLILYVILAKMMTSILKRSQSIDGINQRKKQSLFIELIKHQSTVNSQSWLENYHQTSVDAARSNYYHNLRINSVQTLTQSLGNLTALATLTVGIVLVLEGVVTAGGLIASMMLIWRVVAPIQMTFSALTRIDNFNSSINQLDRIMASSDETQGDFLLAQQTKIIGNLKLEQVSFRYDNDSPSALLGISCEIPQQSVVVIGGELGSGKTSLLRVIAGVLQAQSGQILLDDINNKQFPKIDYRNYVMMFEPLPLKTGNNLLQHSHVYAPEVSAQEIKHAINQVKTKSELFARFHEEYVVSEDTHRQNRDLVGLFLNCVRITLVKPKIVLIDDVESLENLFGESFVQQLIDDYKQSSTMIMVSHNQKWLQIASHLMMLHQGQCQYFGPIEKQDNS